MAEIEKTGVARIRLRQPERGTTAMFCSLLEADRMLAAWNAVAEVPVQCEFALVFTDGESIAGRYPLWRDGHNRPALCTFIRSCLRCDGMKRSKRRDAARLIDQHGNAVDVSILARYDIERV
jgi:hypothetical protein